MQMHSFQVSFVLLPTGYAKPGILSAGSKKHSSPSQTESKTQEIFPVYT